MYKGHRIHLLAYELNPMMFELLKPIYYRNYKGHRKRYISLEKARRLVDILGGRLLLAHPYKYPSFNGKKLVEAILTEKKIDGLECIHSYNNKEEIEVFLKYAIDNNVGSDFHYEVRRYKEYDRLSDIGYLDTVNCDIASFLSQYHKCDAKGDKYFHKILKVDRGLS